MARELPKLTIRGKTYYVDERLMQLRNVKNPHDYIDFWDNVQMRMLIMLARFLESEKGEMKN